MEASFAFSNSSTDAGYENPERGLSILTPTPVTSTSQITSSHPSNIKSPSSSSAQSSSASASPAQTPVPALTAPLPNPPPPPISMRPPLLQAPIHMPAYTRINSIPQPVPMSSLSRLPSLPTIHPSSLSMVVPHPTSSMGYPPYSFAGFDPTYGSSSGYMQALGVNLGAPYQLYGTMRGISTNSSGSGVGPERTDSKMGAEGMAPVQTLSNLTAMDPNHLLSPHRMMHPPLPQLLHHPHPPIPHPMHGQHLQFIPTGSSSISVQFSNGIIPQPLPYPAPYHIYRPPQMNEAVLSPSSYAAFQSTPAGLPLVHTSSTSSSTSSVSSSLDPARFYQNMKILTATSPRLLALPCDSHSQTPSFVTSMQYDHILHRREKRKLEGSTGTKRHKHKSRQLHAARRMRGQGGRFLTKAEKEKMARQQAAITAQANAQTAGLQTGLQSKA